MSEFPSKAQKALYRAIIEILAKETSNVPELCNLLSPEIEEISSKDYSGRLLLEFGVHYPCEDSTTVTISVGLGGYVWDRVEIICPSLNTENYDYAEARAKLLMACSTLARQIRNEINLAWESEDWQSEKF